jgi:sarcosine oxidase subunit delta
MRLSCPHCGERDLREFTYRGHALALSRPSEGAVPQEWHDYVHIRDNPAGDTSDLWYHGPCGGWMVVERNTVTHRIRSTASAREAKR